MALQGRLYNRLNETVVSSRHRKRYRSEINHLPTRRRRRNQSNVDGGRRIERPSTTTSFRRLVVVLLLASLSATNDGFAPVCDAFVTPTSGVREIAIRSGDLTVSGNENSKLYKNTSAILKHPMSVLPSSKSPPSRNDATGSSKNNDIDNSSSSRNRNNAEITGFILAVGIILSLAGLSAPSGGGGEGTTTSVAVMTKVVENTVPTTSTEVVAVTLGESLAGVIGAIFSVGIKFIMKKGNDKDDSSKSSVSENSENNKSGSRTSLLAQGLSDSDYFIANSASNSLLEAVGVPEAVAKYSSVFIAAIPSQLVKIGSRLSEEKRAKEEGALSVLDEQQGKETISRNATASSLKNNKSVNREKLEPIANGISTTEGAASPPTTTVTNESTATSAGTAVDFVEVFADVARWLEYDVLKTEYGQAVISQLWMVENDQSTIGPLQSAITFALLGSLAAVSSRFYADVLYGRFSYGPIEKQREVRRRDNAEWFSMYLTTAASAASLFGFYEFFQLPIGRYIQGTLSGGVEGCFGSSRFNACMQTYIDTNSPGPTAEAQLRALLTNLYAVYIRLQDIAGDTTSEDVSALIRAWSVSLASYIANMQ